MATTAKIWFAQFVDNTGQPISGVKVYHYVAGTTTDKDVYADQGKTTTLSQPVGGDGSGFVFFYGDGTYRLKIVDNDNILLHDLDAVEITGSNTGTAGRILFYGSSTTVTDDDDFTWDSTNKRLGVGTSTNITEAIVMKPGGFLAAERTGAGPNEGAKGLIGLNNSNKVSIDRQAMGIVLETLPVSGLLYLDSNGQIQVLTLTNGQLPIGSNGANPVANQLTAGAGIGITQSAGVSTITNSGVSVIDKSGTSVAVSNTVVDTNLISVTIPGNKMGEHGQLICSLAGTYLNNTAGDTTGTLKVKYSDSASPSLISIFEDTTPNIANSAALRAWQLNFIVQNAAATNSQRIFGSFRVSVITAATAGTGNLATVDLISSTFGGTASMDTTTSSTLAVSWTHSAADANLAITKYLHHVLLVP